VRSFLLTVYTILVNLKKISKKWWAERRILVWGGGEYGAQFS
jgi:hypothetical protein